MLRFVALTMLLADGPWHTLSNDDGLLLEAQDADGSSYERLRVTCTSKAPAEAVFNALWGKVTDTSLAPEVQKRDVLLDEPRERLIHDHVHAPIVSDRDFVMRQTASVDENGVWTVHFDSTTDPRYPEKDGIVRISKIHVLITVSPAEQGSKLVYTNHTEAGGSIPAFVTKGAARKSAINWTKEVRRRAEEQKAK